jgi:nucleotide-binding universal stress UspA family protein
MKRVLVPLDGTKNAEAALAPLAELCGPEDEIILLTVEKREAPQRAGYQPSPVVTTAIAGAAAGAISASAPDVPVYVETGEQALQRQIDESRDYLESLAAGLRNRGHRVATEVLIDEHPDKAIVDYARETKPAFIAMLRRTKPTVAELIFGSVATSVMRADVAPVLFVPSPIPEETAAEKRE